jgi:hypothetical protein
MNLVEYASLLAVTQVSPYKAVCRYMDGEDGFRSAQAMLVLW